MDRLKEIKDKYEMNGVESLTSEEIEYVESEFKRTLEDDLDFKLKQIIISYYTKKDNFNKIIDICDYVYKKGEGFKFYQLFDEFMKNFDVSLVLKKLMDFDYPFVYKFLGDYYSSIDKEKSLQYYDKGAKEGSAYCSLELFEHYADYDFLSEQFLKNFDIEKAFYYLDLNLKTKTNEYKTYFESTPRHIFRYFEESDTLSKDVKEKCNNIIMSSFNLLFYRSLHYIYKYKSSNDTSDFEQFLYYCTLSAEDENDNAEEILIKYLDNITKFAEQGNAVALYTLGCMYQCGLGLEKHDKKAKELFEKSAQQGNSAALNRLGCMYCNGLVVKRDYKKAKELFEKSAQQGNASALYNLGEMYYDGVGVKHDYKKAIEYYEKAAELGNKRSKKIIMRYRYAKEEKIEYNELFLLEEDAHEDDLYYEKIKKMIADGGKIISVKALTDLDQIQIPRDVQDNNKIKDYIIKSLLEFFDEKKDDTVINIRQMKDLTFSSITDFYAVSDLKKIVNVYKKFFDGIDLNQNQEDIFMQIYIKLALMISYDHDALKKYKNEKRSTSRNLMTFLNKKGVCQGYAVILKNVLDFVGIKSNILGSKSDRKGGGHAYNQVEINGKWYYCDLTWDCSLMKCGLVFNCLKSKKSFISVSTMQFMRQIYHQNESSMFEHEANEDYPNVQALFMRNKYKLFNKKLNTPLEQLIEPAGIKEDGGRSR